MQWSIYTLTSGSKSVAQRLAKVKDVYASWDIQNRMKDGNMTYPKVGDEPETNSGMELEFRYALLLGYTILNQFLPQ